MLNVQNAVTVDVCRRCRLRLASISVARIRILSQTLTISNVGTAAESYSLAVAPRNAGQTAPALGSATVTVQPGQSATVPVTFTGSNLAAGAYEGFVTIRGSQSGIQERVPYWYGISSDTPATITPLFVMENDDDETPNAGARIPDAIEFLVTDASGIILTDVQPKVTAVQGGGSVINVVSIDSQTPGAFSVTVRLGPRVGAEYL